MVEIATTIPGDKSHWYVDFDCVLGDIVGKRFRHLLQQVCPSSIRLSDHDFEVGILQR